MHRILFSLGFTQDTAGGAYSAPSRPRSCIYGDLLLRGGRGKMEQRGRGKEREGDMKRSGEVKEGEEQAPQIFWPGTAVVK